jgi:5-carboxymethyl-2-hydroxymuconic-semialdehyde dehydrogenase
MDKVTPKSADVFRANRDRAAPLLARLRSEGIGHMIDGKIVPSISGQTFETKSPIDGAALASVARGGADDINRAATAASLAFKSWRDLSARCDESCCIASRMRSSSTLTI